MKLAKFLMGCTVEGSGVYYKAMIPVTHDVCHVCLGGGRDFTTGEICVTCKGYGEIAPSTENDE